MNPFDVAEAVERLKIAFAALLEESKHGGAALALYQGNRCILSLHGGEDSPGKSWNATTPCLIWSASKGIAAACVLHVFQQHDIDLQMPVVTLWPKFGVNGKNGITFAELFSHRAGLAALDAQGLAITDHDAVTQALAAQTPNWDLSSGKHGYGARTFGFLLDEIIWRITGLTLADYWNQTFREPLNLDLWFGVPEKKLLDVATVIAPKTPPAPSDFSRAFADPSSLTRRALSEPGGLLTPSVMNTSAMRTSSIPSLGAISTADALARFYSLLASPNQFFNETTRLQMQNTLTRGMDQVLITETSFSAGFMTNEFGVYGSGKNSFGHPGAGGSVGFANPDLGIGFAFIPSAMHPGALPGPRTSKLVQTLYKALS
jgi:CubicO group peptidase (beta-lactamase class C family)